MPVRWPALDMLGAIKKDLKEGFSPKLTHEEVVEMTVEYN